MKSHGVKMFDPLTGSPAGDDLIFLVDPVRGNDRRDMLADNLIRCMSKGSLGGGIPALDNSIKVLADDGILRGLNNRRQETSVCKSFGILLFQTPALRNVVKDQHDAQQVALLVFDWSGTVVDGPLDTIPADENRAICQSDDMTKSQDLLDGIFCLLAALFVDDFEDDGQRLPFGFVLPPAGQRLCN